MFTAQTMPGTGRCQSAAAGLVEGAQRPLGAEQEAVAVGVDRQAAGESRGGEAAAARRRGWGRCCSPSRRWQGRPAAAAERGRHRRAAALQRRQVEAQPVLATAPKAELDQHAVGRESEIAHLAARVDLLGASVQRGVPSAASTPSQGSAAATSSAPSGKRLAGSSRSCLPAGSTARVRRRRRRQARTGQPLASMYWPAANSVAPSADQATASRLPLSMPRRSGAGRGARVVPS